MTQEKLASLVDLDRVTIGYIEQGVRTPRLRSLVKISKTLGHSLEDFFRQI